MKRMIAAATCLAALGGCVTAEPPPGPPPGVNPEHDNYCRSLMMPPGTLVYTQCRLAMSETQREAEDVARQSLSTAIGPLPPPIEAAMRDDVFCNFNESSKLSVAAGEPAALALQANGLCTSTRARVGRELETGYPAQAALAISTYDRDTIATNTATIAEARAFR